MSTFAPEMTSTDYPIFVSYAREDAKAVLPIVEQLRNEGFRLWIDLEGIEGASFWRKEIVRAIERSQVVLFFASRASCASESISKELALANEDRKAILPVFLEDAALPSELRYQLAGLQRIAWFQNRHIAYGQLLLALRRLIDPEITEIQLIKTNTSSKQHGLFAGRRNVVAGTAATVALGGGLALWKFLPRGHSTASAENQQNIAIETSKSRSPQSPSSTLSALRAIVIGNQNYASPHLRLKNPVADAKTVAAFLRTQEFNVTELLDLTMSQTRDQVTTFYEQSTSRSRNLEIIGNTSTSADPILYFFFYSGHAINYNNELCILPVDVDGSSAGQAELYTIPVTDLLASRYGVKPRNQLTLYAAAPGQLAYDTAGSSASNSPFTESFIRHLRNPGLDVATLFANVTRDVRIATKDLQTPWVEGSLEAPLYLGDMKRTILEGNTLISVVDACRTAPLRSNR